MVYIKAYPRTQRNELYHHGILGQQWGKKNGPPYPLDASDHSASEKKAGWRKSLDNSEDTDKKKHGLSDRQKKAIKIGAIAVGTALLAIGAYKLGTSGKLDGLLGRGRQAAKLGVDGKQDINFDDLRNTYEGLGFKRLTDSPRSYDEIGERINKDNFDKLSVQARENCKENAFGFFLEQCLGLDASSIERSVDGDYLDFVAKYAHNEPYEVVHRINKIGLKQKFGNKLTKKLLSDYILDQVKKGKIADGAVGGLGSEGMEHTINFIVNKGKVDFYNVKQHGMARTADEWLKDLDKIVNDKFQIIDFTKLRPTNEVKAFIPHH